MTHRAEKAIEDIALSHQALSEENKRLKEELADAGRTNEELLNAKLGGDRLARDVLALHENLDIAREVIENINQSLRLSWFTKDNARAICKDALQRMDAAARRKT